MSTHRPQSFALAPQPIPAALRAIPDPNRDENNKAFRELLRARLTRGAMMCIGCQFTDVGTRATPEGFMDVHHVNHNHADNRPENLYPVCSICHDILEVGFAPSHDRGEVLIGDLCSQDDIVNLSRALMVAAYTDRAYASAAGAMMQEIRDSLWASTRAVMPAEYDGGVETFGTMLQSGVFAARVDQSGPALAKVRYLPRINGYPQATKHWAATTFASLPETEWAHYVLSPS